MNELEAAAAKAQQEVAYRYNALMTAVEVSRSPDGTLPSVENIIATAKKINNFTQGITEFPALSLVPN